MSQTHFQKFVPKKKNSVIKEEHKQAKKKEKKDRATAINKRFEEKRRLKFEAINAKIEAENPSAKRVFDPNYKQKKPAPASIAKQDVRPAYTTTSKQPVKNTTSPAPGKQITKPAEAKTKTATGKEMPLNKFLAHCGVCSRRDAVDVVRGGKVKVNNSVVLEPAFKVSDKDDVIFNGKKIFVTKNLVYILLNKPKDYITTTDDPQGRKTVLQLTKAATTERIYPVGRLDRNTSGVLLLTNDGDLTQKLSHPSYEIKKVYEVKLDKPLTKGDFDKILSGIKLEDGEIKADALGYVDTKDKSVIGIEIHSGRNRIVRRVFESLGYDVKGLDRVMYATLTKKNVERGKWRFLSEKEIRVLKYLNKSKAPSNDKSKA